MWLPHDFALAEAVHILDAEKCGSCGTPAWHAFSENNEIQFVVEETKCEACAAMSEHTKDDKENKPGVNHSVKVVHVDWELGENTPLPGRADWYQEQQKKFEAEEKRKAAKKV